MPVTLDQIIAATRARVAKAKAGADLRVLAQRAQKHQPRGFANALRRAAESRFGMIAELKKASPSRGLIREHFDPPALARELAAAGATALSVLTDEEFFQGSLNYLAAVSAAVEVPLLRKDFIVDEFQVIEARAHGADAILLIVAALDDAKLRNLHDAAKQQGLDVVCEVHDDAELARAVDAGCQIIGVNSRDLRTFKVDLNTALRLGPKIPAAVLRVAESGINNGEDIARLRAAGFDAFLIGESLMKAANPGEAFRELMVTAERAEKVAVR
jgi:indole-3-glycerol phosphate synthase